jgi:hypothetical protein
MRGCLSRSRPAAKCAVDVVILRGPAVVAPEFAQHVVTPAITRRVSVLTANPLARHALSKPSRLIQLPDSQQSERSGHRVTWTAPPDRDRAIAADRLRRADEDEVALSAGRTRVSELAKRRNCVWCMPVFGVLFECIAKPE